MVILNFWHKLSFSQRVIAFLLGVLLWLWLCWLIWLGKQWHELFDTYQNLQYISNVIEKHKELLGQKTILLEKMRGISDLNMKLFGPLLDRLLSENQLNKISSFNQQDERELVVKGSYKNLIFFLNALNQNITYAWKEICIEREKSGSNLLKLSLIPKLEKEKVLNMSYGINIKPAHNPFIAMEDKEIIHYIDLKDIFWLGTICNNIKLCIATAILPNRQTQYVLVGSKIGQEGWIVEKIMGDKLILRQKNAKFEVNLYDGINNNEALIGDKKYNF